jgi:uncharacterized protein CbrC (UPF0167 family)
VDLPAFQYHPDPLATGSLALSAEQCPGCGQARGYAYTGPVYTRQNLAGKLCPWCIADGTAHQRFGATFTDDDGVGGYGDWDPVPDAVVKEVCTRTPGFSGWQQERWWTHCGDAAAYVGAAGFQELQQHGPELVAQLQQDTGLEGVEWEEYFQALDREGSPTAYVFRCRHCGAHGGYSDCD